MSSDLSVFGVWTFPARALAAFRNAALTYPAHAHEEESMAAAFAGRSSARKVSAVISGAKSVSRFLRVDAKGDTLAIRAVLADDDWIDACARIGALARAAASLGATGHLTVEGDGSPAGRLVLRGGGASFDPRIGKKYEDPAGRAELFRLWEEIDRPKTAKASRLSPAEERALERGWAKAEAKYRATWFKGKPEAYVVEQLVQVKADYYTGSLAALASQKKEKATRASRAAATAKRRR